MIKVRWIFEALSSSSHGCMILRDGQCAKKKDKFFEGTGDYVDSHGILHLEERGSMRFERGVHFELIETPYKKTLYAIASLIEGHIYDDTGTGSHLPEPYKSKWDSIIAAVHKHYPEIKGIHVHMAGERNDDYKFNEFTLVDKLKVGDSIIYERSETRDADYYVEGEYEVLERGLSGYYYGYVDGESYGLVEWILKNYNISIEEFIFNSKYVIFLDSDEVCTIPRMIKQGILDPGEGHPIENIVMSGYWEWTKGVTGTYVPSDDE